MNPPKLQILPASPEVREAISRIFAAQMGKVLARFPLNDLADESLCFERLHGAGFASGSIFHTIQQARYRAWELIEPERANPERQRSYLAEELSQLARNAAKRAAKGTIVALLVFYVLGPFLPDHIFPTSAQAVEIIHTIEEAIEEPFEDMGLIPEDDVK